MNQNENPSSSGTQQSFNHDEISNRARELWDRFGRPQGRDEEIWHEAERTLRSQYNSPATAGDGNIPSPEDVSARDTEFESSSAPSPPLPKNKARRLTGSKVPNQEPPEEDADLKRLRLSGDTTSRRRPS